MRLLIELKTLGLFLVGGVAPVFVSHDIPFYKTRGHEKGRDRPTIPGSTIKGAMRSSFSRVAQAFQMRVCGDWPTSYDGCDACYLFGAPGGGGCAYVSDFVSESNTQLLTHVSLDDESGTARRYALYTAEYVPPSTIFKGVVEYAGSIKKLPLLLVAMAALRTDRIGRRGAIDLRITNVDELSRTVSHEIGDYSLLLEYLGRWVWDEDL